MTEQLFSLVAPVVADIGLELVDVERKSNVVLVTVDRAGGVDLEALTAANRVVSAILDESDPIPGAYTLEVSSPGVERTLRTPAQFAKAQGETVSVRTRPQVPGPRRLSGVLVGSDQEGFAVDVGSPAEGETVRLSYADVDRVRTVFHWGGAPPPGGGSAGKQSGGSARTAAVTDHGNRKTQAKTTKTKTKTRKQVTTP